MSKKRTGAVIKVEESNLQLDLSSKITYVQTILDFTNHVLERAISISALSIVLSDICTILQDLKIPLRRVHGHLKRSRNLTSEIESILQLLFAILQDVNNEIIEKYICSRWKDFEEGFGAEHYDRLVAIIKDITTMWDRVGILPVADNTLDLKKSSSKGSSDNRRVSNEAAVDNLWPLTYLPDRNLGHIPRKILLRKMLTLSVPSCPPCYTCIINEGREGGMGKTDLSLEYAYRSLEDETFAVIGWIYASDESSIAASFRYFSRRIKLSDPGFSENANIEDMSMKAIVANVTSWIEKLPIPWLLVFDGADDASFLTENMFPKKAVGPGCVVISSVSSGLAQLDAKVPQGANFVEVDSLSEKEGLEMVSIGLKEGVIEEESKEMIRYLNSFPMELTLAMSTINVMRSRSFFDLGPTDYLSRLHDEIQPLGGNVTNPIGKEISRATTLYKCFTHALYSASDHHFAYEPVITRIIELLAFISPDDIPVSLIYSWLNPPYCVPKLAILKDVRRKVRGSQSEDIIEYQIEVSSLYPRELGNSRIPTYQWKLFKSYNQIKDLYDVIKHKFSPEMKQKKFPPTYMFQSEANVVSERQKELDAFLHALSENPCWVEIAEEADVKAFLGIHPQDRMETAKDTKVLRILEPLISVGLIRVQHRGGFLHENLLLSCGFHSILQAAARHFLQQSGKFAVVSNQVLEFLNKVMKRLFSTRDIAATEVMISHVLRAVSNLPIDADCYDLCNSMYSFAKAQGIYRDAELFSVRCMAITKAKMGKESQEVANWHYNLAECHQGQGKMTQGAQHFKQAITIYEMNSEKRGGFLAQMHYALGMLYQAQNAFDLADKHYTSAIDNWKSTEGPKQKEFGACLNSLAYIKKVQGNFDEAHRLYELALDVCTSVHGPYHEIVATALNNLALLLKKQNQYEEAKIYFRRAIAVYEDLYGGMICEDVGQSMLSMAECLRGQQRYPESEELHRSALDIFNKLYDEKPHAAIAQSQSALASVLIEQGRYEEALVQYESSLAVRRQIYKPDDPLIASCLNNIGQLLKTMCRLTDAKTYFQESLDIYRKTNHKDTPSVLNSLAEILRAQGKYEDALKLMEQALNALRSIHGTDSHADIATGLMTIAALTREQGNLAKARELYQSALDILRSIHGKNHLEVADCLNKLSDVAKANGDQVAGKTFHDEALEIYSMIRGDEGSAQKIVAANALGSIASLLYKEGKFDEAQPMHEQALNILKVQYGENHPFVATALNNLASLLSAQGKFSEAQPMHEEALGILLRVYGEHHPFVATANNNLGELLYTQGKFDEALPRFQQALKCRRYIYGANNPNVAQSLNSLANLYRAMGKYDEAKPLYEESLVIRKELYGTNHRAVATAMNNLGLLLKNMKMLREAEDVMRKSLKVREETYEEDHPAIAVGMNNLGLVLFASGELKEARKFFEQALEIRKDVLGEEHADIACSMYNLAEVLISQSRLGQARKLLEDLIRMRKSLFTDEHPLVLGSRLRLFELLRLMGLLDDYRASNKNIKFEDYLPEHKDFVVSVQEAEEDDEIVSHYLKMDIAIGQSDTDAISKETGYRDQLEEAWCNELKDRLSSEQLKLREELVRLESTLVRLKSNVEISAAEMNSTEEDLEDNLIALQKLQDSGDSSEETLQKIQKLEDFSQVLKLALADKEKVHLAACEELENLEHSARLSRRKLEKEEDIMRRLEQAENTELSARGHVERALLEITKVQEKVDMIQSQIRATSGDNKELADKLNAVLQEKKSYEDAKLRAEEKHRIAVKDLVAFKKRVNQMNSEDDGGADMKPIRREKIKRRSRKEADDDEDILEGEDTDSENEDDGEGEGEVDSALLARLKKKIKKQRVLIKMLKSQVTSTGMKPIEEVITYEKAEEKLKSSLARLLMGDESASDEYDKWDNFVRSHPKYKQQEDYKLDLWKRENESVNLTCQRIVRTYVPAEIASDCTLVALEEKLPKALARRVWTKKGLWMTRLLKDHIAKLHIADLQTKYSCQGLDELELRAVWASLPERFENDPKGEKEAYKTGVFDALKSKRDTLPWSGTEGTPNRMLVDKFISSIERNLVYREFPSSTGPFDPDAAVIEIEQKSHSEGAEQLRKPRSLLDTASIPPSRASATVPDAKFSPKPTPQKLPGSLFPSKIDGLTASTEVLTTKSTTKKLGIPKMGLGPNFLEELKLKSQLRKK